MYTSISKAFFNRQTNELWLLFSDGKCRVYLIADEVNLKRFMSAENRDEYFDKFIRKKYKFYYSVWDMCYPHREAEKAAKLNRNFDEEMKNFLQKFGNGATITATA